MPAPGEGCLGLAAGPSALVLKFTSLLMLEPRYKIDKYEVDDTQLIGKGCYGVVHAARARCGGGRLVAKSIHACATESDQSRRRQS